MHNFHHYLPVNDTNIQWGLYVTGGGYASFAPHSKYPPSGHPRLYSFDYNRGRVLPEFTIVLISKGQGIFESLETGHIPIQTGTLFILFPGIWHRYKPDEQTGWTERWIALNGITPHQLLEQGYLSPEKAVLHLSEPEHLISAFDQLLDQIKLNHSDNSLIYSMDAIRLLRKVIGTIDNNKITPVMAHETEYKTDDNLVKSALDLIWTYSHRQISVDSLLTQLPTSRRTLERRFRKICAHSIYDEIIECRLSRAKRLLRETQMPIKTVAYLSGFKYSKQLRYAFEKVMGQSPSQFRKQYL